MSEIIVSPSILNVDKLNLAEVCKDLQNSGADWLHCDVMDGVFVPNKSLGVKEVARLKELVDMPLDVHLMVQNPGKVVADYANSGADIITFHLEATKFVAETAEAIRKLGCKVGISVKPSTSIEELLPYKDLLDMILVMTVEPGLGGQKLIEECLTKVKMARELFPTKLIEVDGGINAKTAALAVEQGANVLVAGSFLVSAENRKEAIDLLKKGMTCKEMRKNI